MLKIVDLVGMVSSISSSIIFLLWMRFKLKVNFFTKLTGALCLAVFLDIIAICLLFDKKYGSHYFSAFTHLILIRFYTFITFVCYIIAFTIFAKNKFFYTFFNFCTVITLLVATLLNIFYNFKIFAYLYFFLLLLYCLLHIYEKVKSLDLGSTFQNTGFYFSLGIALPVLLSLPFIPISYYIKEGHQSYYSIIYNTVNKIGVITMYFFFYKSIKSYTWTEK